MGGCKAFVETKRDKDGLLSEEDAKTYAEMEKKVQAYAAEIERMEQMEAMEAEMNRPVNTPIVTKPVSDKQMPEKKGRAADAYKAAMLDTSFRLQACEQCSAGRCRHRWRLPCS